MKLFGDYLLFDGAMGTFYANLTGDFDKRCELENLSNPQIIKEIHEKYIKAGAMAIKTNTFSANSSLSTDKNIIKEIITSGYHIATEAAKTYDVLVFADIGPVPKNNFDEYKEICDLFLNLKAEHFLFETFSDYSALKEIASYIKQKNKNATILAQFAITPDGYTKSGISGKEIIRALSQDENIDAIGFNCLSGPKHLYEYIKNINIRNIDKMISIMPNAGYPTVENERTIFINNPEYFAEMILNIKQLGVKILGGCCGVHPEHIGKAALLLRKSSGFVSFEEKDASIQISEKIENTFREKLESGKKVIAVELDPPNNHEIHKMIKNAQILKQCGADIITISDCPFARARVDSSILAAKIKREIGIETMPHLTCRDRNLNALWALITGLYIEEIRNILVVTGDPVPAFQSDELKGVFNLNSFKLTHFIEDLNQNMFQNDGVYIGCALNVNAENFDGELKRAIKKEQEGACYFLTQPVFTLTAKNNIIKAKKVLKSKILCGILPLVSYKNACFSNNEISGIKIPEQMIDSFKDLEKEEAQKQGIEISCATIKELVQYVDGFYLITPFNRVGIITEIIDFINKM